MAGFGIPAKSRKVVLLSGADFGGSAHRNPISKGYMGPRPCLRLGLNSLFSAVIVNA